MTPFGILAYVFTAIVFVMWAFSMFRTLFAMQRRASDRIGKSLPGPIDTLSEWGIWLRTAEFQRERRQLLFQTLAMIALSVLLSANLSAIP